MPPNLWELGNLTARASPEETGERDIPLDQVISEFKGLGTEVLNPFRIPPPVIPAVGREVGVGDEADPLGIPLVLIDQKAVAGMKAQAEQKGPMGPGLQKPGHHVTGFTEGYGVAVNGEYPNPVLVFDNPRPSNFLSSHP